MTKFCVKKPYFVFVAVVIVLTIGAVSLSKMQTDMLPNMELPYMMVITTEPGASPEKVENDVTKPVEGALGVVKGVEKIESTSSENYSMTMLQFADKTDMNAALVRVSKAVNALKLPDECGEPNTMEISPDMMATMYASVDYDGKSITDLTTFTNKVLKPYLERQEGVGNITESGNVSKTVEIRLSQKKIDQVNDKILEKTDTKLADARKKLKKQEQKLRDAKSKLVDQKKQLSEKQQQTNDKLGKSQVSLNKVQATKAAYEASLQSLKANQKVLEAEKSAYEKAGLAATYEKVNAMFKQLQDSYGEMAKQSGVEIPTDVKDAVQNPDKLKKFTGLVKKLGYEDQVKDLTEDNLKKMYTAVEVRMPQIESELASLQTKIMIEQKIVDGMNKNAAQIDKGSEGAISGGYSAAAGFGAGTAQMASGESQVDEGIKKIEDAQKELKKSQETARKNSNIDAMLSMDALTGLITAQNFSMPAGYVEDKKGTQWLVKVGQKYTKEKQLKNMVLAKVPGAGDVKISDIAHVTMVTSEGNSYAKINGKDAILLSIFKTSTSNTSDVSKALKKSFQELEKKYSGLTITPLMDQGDFIKQILNSVLSSILLGAILAIVVLALFLKDIKPTLVVAFSIPFSVLFAVIIMYFTGITLNVMSLAGLCLGIGMLVDNSIVVMENVYRLRHRGLSAPRAAVQGARQVAAPIIASTVTTICVFLPMVYTTGTVADLLIPFAFTISYALIASLIVALTVVPTIGSVILKRTKTPSHNIFDRIKRQYAKALSFSLKYKIVPLGIAIVLLAICVFQMFRMGIVMLDDMESNQISISMTMDDDCDKETAYATADKVMKAIMSVKGVAKTGAIDGNASMQAGSVGGGDDSAYRQFTFQVLTDDDIKTTNQFRTIRKQIKEKMKNIKCKDYTVNSSTAGGMSSMGSSGIEVDICGNNHEKLMAISQDVMKMVKDIKGTENVTNGIDATKKEVKVTIDKNKAAEKGLTVAQIFQQLSADISTDKTAITMETDTEDIDVKLVNKTNLPTYEKLLKTKIIATKKDQNGNDIVKEYKLSDFAKTRDEDMLSQLTRSNQSPYLAVSADVKEGYNAILLSRKLQKSLNKYKAPEGYTVEISGSANQINDMVKQLLEALALGLLLIYLVMVAQFQSLLSPFIILFTIPLAFTGGMIGLLVFGQKISAMAMMGFMILMGTVVNNGIVFVDYVNQLRLQGMEKHAALIATGKTRMRPILMTALTTILSMSVMVFSQDAGNAMQKGMAIVVSAGLIYSTLMTLFIVPVMYDILYRRQPKNIDVGEDDLDEVPNEVKEFLEEMKES